MFGLDGLHCSSFEWMALTVSITLQLLGVEVGVLSHAAAAGGNKDHIVAVVDVRRASFYAEPLHEYVRGAA